MERHQRELEADSGDDHGDADQAVEIGRAAGLAQRTDAGERQGAEIGVDQRHAEQQKGGGGAAEDEVFHPGLGGVLARAGIGDQAEQGDAEGFQTEEEGGEVNAGRQHRGAERRGEQQQIIFLARRLVAIAEIDVGENRDDQRRAQYEAGIEQRGAVDDEERRHGRGGGGCGERQRNAAQREAGDGGKRGEPMAAMGGDGQHHHDGDGAEQGVGRKGQKRRRRHLALSANCTRRDAAGAPLCCRTARPAATWSMTGWG